MPSKVFSVPVTTSALDFTESPVMSVNVYEISTWSKSLSAGLVQLKFIEESSLEYDPLIEVTLAGAVKSKLSIVICAASSRPSESSAATVYVPFAVSSAAVISKVHFLLPALFCSAFFASASASKVAAFTLPSFLYTTSTIFSAAVSTFTVTVTEVLLFASGTLSAIFIVSFESTTTGVASTVTPPLVFPLVSIAFTVNVYFVPFVSPVTTQPCCPFAAIRLSFSRATKARPWLSAFQLTRQPNMSSSVASFHVSTTEESFAAATGSVTSAGAVVSKVSAQQSIASCAVLYSFWHLAHT